MKLPFPFPGQVNQALMFIFSLIKASRAGKGARGRGAPGVNEGWTGAGADAGTARCGRKAPGISESAVEQEPL